MYLRHQLHTYYCQQEVSTSVSSQTLLPERISLRLTVIKRVLHCHSRQTDTKAMTTAEPRIAAIDLNAYR